MEKLSPRDLISIVKELRRQKVLADYNEQLSHWNFLAAVFTNGIRSVTAMFSKRKTKEKVVEPKDYLSDSGKKLYDFLSKDDPEPENGKGMGKWKTHTNEAKNKGMFIPWGGGEE